jgi:hypothetical protein
LVLLIVNDHVLKDLARSVRAIAPLTGKLSDLAGLAFLPVFVVAVTELLTRRRFARVGPSVRGAVGVVVAVAVFFALMNTTELGGLAFQHGLGLLQWPFLALRALALGAGVPPPRLVQHVVDPTDLLALPAAFYVVAQARSRARSWANRGATNASNSSL